MHSWRPFYLDKTPGFIFNQLRAPSLSMRLISLSLSNG
jgi:hypothetical protein